MNGEKMLEYDVGSRRWQAHVKTRKFFEGTTATNLVVERRGKRRPASIIVVGGHDDSVPATPTVL